MTDYDKEADNMLQMVNYTGMDYKRMAMTMANRHRTLQQNFMRLVVHFIKAEANNYNQVNYDSRNDGTCALCAKLQKSIEEEGAYLPYI